MDFGTGAIYRRIPARKVVPNDREWFAMTLIAAGPHLRTWVNGYPVVDWIDKRPPDENPRNGSRVKPGHLSLQGHDPTTDLSFRNLRVAGLKD
jgi:3-keto-disaccharide hydrolase